MANDDILTDDFVADLLAKEAKDCSVKYSALGLDAYKSSKYELRASSLMISSSKSIF